MAVTSRGPDVVYVLRALGLGDLLTAVPALRALRGHFDGRVVLAVPASLGALALHTGAVDAVVPTTGLGDVRAIGRRPTVAVNLHGRGPQSVDHLKALQPRTLLTHRHPLHPDIEGPVWDGAAHEVDRWCGLLRWAGIDAHPDELALPRPAGYPDGSGVVVVHPGAAAPARRWPVERFGVVAAALSAHGHRVVVTGSASETAIAHGVASWAGLPESAVLAGKLDVLGMVALMHDARLLVCGDTGVAHIATATGTPSVLIFGPTAPSMWGPRRADRHVVLWAGGSGDPHAAEPDAGLLAIDPGVVVDCCRNLLRECA